MEPVAEPCISPEDSTMNAKNQPQNPTLPQELMTEILVRLPAKSVGQFRTVSKPWRSLLSNPHFIKSHFAFHSAIPSPPKLIYACPFTFGLHTLTFTSTVIASSRSRIDAVSRKLVKYDGRWDSVPGSCHGLVLAIDYGRGSFIVNPTTQELVEVPKFSLALDPESYDSIHGFGYDSSSEDYKIVTLTFPRETDRVETFVDVYSLKMKTWRRVGSFPYGRHTPCFPYRGIFLNGALHWLATDRTIESSPTIVAAFNLSVEKFELVPAPSTFEVHTGQPYIHVFGGCLGIVSQGSRSFGFASSGSYSRGHTDFWVQKVYGMQESWTKFNVTVPQGTESLCEPICQLGDEEVVLIQDCLKLVLYNLKKHTLREMVVDGIFDAYPSDIIDFPESLVSPSFSGWDGEAHP